MRIGIDCRLSGPKHAGIGRYVANLIARLPNKARQVTWVYFVDNPTQTAGLTAKNVEIVVTPIRHYSFAEQLTLPAVYRKAKLDLLHVPHFNVPLLYQGKLVVTIHDLLWHEYRGTQVTTLNPVFYWLKYTAYRLVSTAAISKADCVLVPAETIKKTLIRHYPKALSKIVVTKEGVASDFRANSNSTLPKITLPKNKKVLLYVGSLYPHKNMSLVVQALPKLPDYHVLIVGARSVFQDQLKTLVQEQGVVDQVSFLGYLSDSDLRQVMNRVFALIQPSLSEGFGLTGVEAMATGLPVIASQIPIFQEIYGRAALFFTPTSVASFIDTVNELDEKTRQHLQKMGFKQVQNYDWQTMTEQTLEAYQSVLTKKI